MVSERDAMRIRRFVCSQLRDEPDLSSLTLGILKKRYLAHVGCDSLSPDARNYMKRVVQEELMKMQDSDKSGSDQENKKPQNKRKREEEHEITSESEEESKAKRGRCQSSSSSESEDKNDSKSESEESEGEAHFQLGSNDTQQEVKKSQPKTNGNDEQQVTSKDSNDEESSESEKEGNQSDFEDKSKEKVKKKANPATDEETKSSKTNEEKETSQSDDENQTDTDSKSELSSKNKNNDSSDEGKKESAEKKNNESDSDSSSLPSLEDEQNGGIETKQDNKKRKVTKKDESTRDQKDENKAIVRLKRYIALCGVRRNYKKLLDGCRSVRSKVAVLKKELEDLGVHGNPSIDKCKKVRMKREEAQELAELDVSNIIATQGRPKRRGTSAWQEPKEPPSSAYKRTLNSDSDSDEENNGQRGHRRATDWANLQGIISDDGESD